MEKVNTKNQETHRATVLSRNSKKSWVPGTSPNRWSTHSMFNKNAARVQVERPTKGTHREHERRNGSGLPQAGLPRPEWQQKPQETSKGAFALGKAIWPLAFLRREALATISTQTPATILRIHGRGKAHDGS